MVAGAQESEWGAASPFKAQAWNSVTFTAFCWSEQVTGPAWTQGWRLHLSTSGLPRVYRDVRPGWQPYFQADYK